MSFVVCTFMGLFFFILFWSVMYWRLSRLTRRPVGRNVSNTAISLLEFDSLGARDMEMRIGREILLSARILPVKESQPLTIQS